MGQKEKAGTVCMFYSQQQQRLLNDWLIAIKIYSKQRNNLPLLTDFLRCKHLRETTLYNPLNLVSSNLKDFCCNFHQKNKNYMSSK